ncbi:MAG: hypothetical protein AB1646_20260 [Thermodesulfobacteriota bacterium]
MKAISRHDIPLRDALVGQIEDISGITSVEEVAQTSMEILYDHFSHTVVLARLFATVPFGELPATNKQIVRGLAQSAHNEQGLRNNTLVLSLLGTRGMESKWNDRLGSQGHVGIPLISSSFISSIPMLSRLLRQLGAELDWFEQADCGIVDDRNLSRFGGLFYVRDAATEVDRQGRKVIVAQDFVRDYGIKTVFGFGGGMLVGCNFLVSIFFCRSLVEREDVEPFRTLINAIKIAAMAKLISGDFFKNAS